MNKKSVQNNKLTIKDIAVMGVMVATMTAFKYAMSFIPNVEPVSLLIILYTLFLGPKVIYAIVVFILVEGLIYGFGTWWVSYLYIWPLLSLLTHLFRKHTSPVFFSVLSGIFGLFFGALTATNGHRTINYQLLGQLNAKGNEVISLTLGNLTKGDQ